MTRTQAVLPFLLVASLAVEAADAAPAAKKLHVALLGDSLAYGAGDETGKGIAGRLVPELQQRGIAVATTNFGANGATTAEVSARLAEAKTQVVLRKADAIVLSMGANDVRKLLRSEQSLGAVMDVVDGVLQNMDATVTELHRINPRARILILGAYTPVAHERASVMLGPLVAMWDATLEAQFAEDPLVDVVRMSDIVDRPERLSTLDSFHPGGEAYQAAAGRIAGLIAGREAEVTAPAR